MISKVIAWGRDRAAALDTLDAALAGYTALGIDTNVEYLRLLINDADVRAGRLDTGLIERQDAGVHLPRGSATPNWWPRPCRARDAGAEATGRRGRPWHAVTGWRLGAPAPRRISLGTPGRRRRHGGRHRLRSRRARSTRARRRRSASARHHCSVLETWPRGADPGAAKPAAYALAPVSPGGPVPPESRRRSLGAVPRQRGLVLPARGAHPGDPAAPGCWPPIEREEGAADPAVRSPMPGTVVSVSVSNGDAVDGRARSAVRGGHEDGAPARGAPGRDRAHQRRVRRPREGRPGAGHHPPRRPATASGAEDTIEEAVIAMGAAD